MHPKHPACFVVALVVACLIAPLARAAEQVMLVRDGQPASTIVIAAQPSENARAAAAELQRYLERMSGARVPIADDAAVPASPGTVILVGRSKLTDSFNDLKIPDGLTKDLREEGFVLRARGDHVILAGNDKEPYYGTRYAVAELLHRLGVRWFLPGTFGEVVPKRATVGVEPADDTQRPDFPVRNWWEHARGDMAAETAEWKIHNKMNPRSQDWFGVPGDGSIGNYLPGKEVFEAHPDWFALTRDGKRDAHMACMTSLPMIDHFIEKVKADARAGKRVSSFAPEDGNPRCYCENCAKLATGFDGYGANDRDPLPDASTSNEWFHFVNEVLKGVNAEFPDHMIATNGYANRDIPPDLPPAERFNASKNLVVMFANIGACTLHAYDDPRCWQMNRQADMLRAWMPLCDKVWLYNYNYTMLVSKYTLTPMVHRIRRDIPLLKQWGSIGFFDQDESDWAMTGIPTRVVRARLEWDTKADVDAIQADFFEKWFGPASKSMRRYYDALETAFEKTTQHGHEDVILQKIYTDALMTELGHEMSQAQRLATDEPFKARVALEKLSYDQLLAFSAMEKAEDDARFAEAAAQAGRIVELMEAKNKATPYMGWHPYPVYDPAWEKKRMEGWAAKAGGAEGDLIAVLPAEARFRPDPLDEGRFARWQEPETNDANWKTVSTTDGWDGQGYLDEHGHPYRGVAWYRMSVDVPASAAGRDVVLAAPAAVNEVWVWVNGAYAGHRAYMQPWFRPQAVELPVGGLIRPGKPNQVTLRVLCNYDVWGANGIYERMFLYAKKPGAATQPAVPSR